MSKKHRTRQLVKVLLRERARANFFSEALAEEMLVRVNERLAEIIGQRKPEPMVEADEEHSDPEKGIVAFNVRMTPVCPVTYPEGEPREDQAQD